MIQRTVEDLGASDKKILDDVGAVTCTSSATISAVRAELPDQRNASFSDTRRSLVLDTSVRGVVVCIHESHACESGRRAVALQS